MTDRIPAALRLIPQVRRVVRQSDEARRDAERRLALAEEARAAANRRADAAEEAHRQAAERMAAAQAVEDHLIMLPRGPDAKYAVPMNYAPSRDPRPRWGYTQPLIPSLRDWFASHAASYEMFLDEMARSARLLADIPRDFKPERFPEPGWHRLPFTPFDLLALYTMVRLQKPENYVVVGTTMSTCFAARAIRDHGLNTRIVSIAPESNAEIDAICDEVRGEGLETCDLTIFDTLRAGDIVFVNGSHRSFTNSDVTVFMIDVLPRLQPGVVIQIHDVVLPWDYDNMFLNWYWNEQYIVAAYMMAGRDRLDPLLPTAFICQDSGLSRRLRRPFIDFGDDRLNSGWQYGGSMWFTHLAVATEPSGRPAAPDRELVTDQTPEHQTLGRTRVVVRHQTVDDLIDDLAEFGDRLHDAGGLDAANRLIDRNGLNLYLRIMLHPDLGSLTSERRRAALRTIISQMMSQGNRHSRLIAHGFSVMLERRLQESEPDLLEVIELYDANYSLNWVAACDFVEMAQFDAQAVHPVAAYFRRLAAKATAGSLVIGPRGRRRRICYCCHNADLRQANAVGPILLAMMKDHAARYREDHEIYLYAVQWFDDGFLDALRDVGITVRAFSTANNRAETERLRGQFAADRIDVVLTDQASGLMTYLYESRVAPLQLWLEMGFPFWSIANLDWTFLGHKGHRPYFGVRADTCSLIRYREDSDRRIKPPDPAALAALREEFPENARLLGGFGRFTKIREDYLKAAELILTACPTAHLVIAGNGDPGLIHTFLAQSPMAPQVRVIERYVDIGLYGSLIEIFLDTFPFCGGNTVREILSLGKPVVAHRTDDWPDLIENGRDPELVADTTVEYARIALRLLGDAEYYRSRQQEALRIAVREHQPEETTTEVYSVIEQLVRDRLCL